MNHRKTIGVTLISIVALLLLLEGGSKWLLLKIYNRQDDPKLLTDRAFGSTSGFKSNASGIVFGKHFHTDAYGGRLVLPHKPGKRKWLFIGDSVAEGLGVTDSSTFYYLLNNSIPNYEIRCVAVSGWAPADYVNVAGNLFNRQEFNSARLTLCWCLNDIYPKAITQHPAGQNHLKLLTQINLWFQKNMAVYQLLKLFVFRNSDSYYRYHSSPYQNEAMVREAVAYLDTLQHICSERKTPFEVLLLPYRSQLKNNDTLPQKIMMTELQKHGIRSRFIFKELKNDPDGNYLFADEIHFSEKGHQAIFRAFMED
ncbi:MAG: SGNH/GDSL hydrolase family protein [Chitinophagales bacterium]